jgi:hypothetical protein
MPYDIEYNSCLLHKSIREDMGIGMRHKIGYPYDDAGSRISKGNLSCE